MYGGREDHHSDSMVIEAQIDDKNQWNKVKKFSKQSIVNVESGSNHQRLDTLEELLEDPVIPNFVGKNFLPQSSPKELLIDKESGRVYEHSKNCGED